MPLPTPSIRWILLAGLALAGLAVRASSRSDGSPTERLHPVTLVYESRAGDSLIGVREVRLRRDGELWEHDEVIRSGTLHQRATHRFRADLSPVSDRAAVSVGAEQGRLSLSWTEGRVRGWLSGSPSLGGERRIDLAAPAGVVLQGTESWLLAASPLAVGRELRLQTLDPFSGEVRRVRARVVAAEQVSLAAGRFDALRVELDGGTRLWVRRAPPHLTLRESRPGRPTLELTALH